MLRSYVVARLGERWSPQQISRALRRAHPEEPALRVATETIYRPATGILRKPAPSPSRTGRDHRRGHTRQIRAGRRFAQAMLSVRQRGFEPTDRSVAGHWEGDLIVGPHSGLRPWPLRLDPRLRTEPLWREQRVLVVPQGHHLAGRESVSILDTKDEIFVAASGGVPE